MLFFDYIFIGLVVFYLCQMVFLRWGLEKTRKYNLTIDYEPMVSVIVAARNEEENIRACIESLLQLEYPKEKCELIIIDDGSTDRTGAIAQSFAKIHNHVRVIVSATGQGNLRGKANALSQGIDQSKGEILLFTDADCVVPPTWIRETVAHYAPGVAVVAGFTLLRHSTAFEAIQAIDWFLLFGVSAATAAWNMPLTGIGNNLSVRRSAYDAVGGYRNLPFSVTEDYALVQAVWQKTRMEVRYPLNRKTLVVSKPCATLRSLFRQRQRWSVGGLEMVFRGFVLMAIPFALHLSFFVGFLLSPSWLWWTIMSVKIAGDIFLLWYPIRVFKEFNLLQYFLFFELYFIVYEMFIPFIALLSRKVVWKERSFKDFQ